MNRQWFSFRGTKWTLRAACPDVGGYMDTLYIATIRTGSRLTLESKQVYLALESKGTAAVLAEL